MKYISFDKNINRASIHEIECDNFACSNNCFGDCLSHEQECGIEEEIKKSDLEI